MGSVAHSVVGGGVELLSGLSGRTLARAVFGVGCWCCQRVLFVVGRYVDVVCSSSQAV